jgi:hypothetical protein
MAISRITLVSLVVFAVTAQAAVPTIENETLRVILRESSNTVLFQHKATGRVFMEGRLVGGERGPVSAREVTHKTFGRGQGLAWSPANGRGGEIMLFPGLPFALLRPQLHNTRQEPDVTRRLDAFSASLDLGVGSAPLTTLGTGGLLAPDKNPGSYAWLAVAEPKSRAGVVWGWLTHERGSGVVFSKVEEGRVWLEARLDFGQLRLEPGATESLETLAMGCFDDARLGLEAWADAVARLHDIKLRPQPAGYCTWYSRPHGGASDEKSLAELSSFAATNLAPYGFSVVQIDDGWQAGISTNGPKRDFSRHRPGGSYANGMKSAADQIKSVGLVPGIWFMPFAGTWYDPVFKEHQDWFIKRLDGKPYETAWGGTCLDMTHPGARGWLADNARRIAHEWGYQYFKMDGLWTGTGTRQQYINTGYKDDGIGDAALHDPHKTNLEAYRDGLRLVREAAGPDVFFLGCCAPQNMRSYAGAFGLVDAMRIGPDNGANWSGLLRGPVFGSRHYFLHGRVWYNDPDPVYVRTNLSLHHARLITSWVALSGQLNLSSEWLPGLPAERLDVLRRTMPGHGLLPRPVDLFENDPPRMWVLTDADQKAGTKREVSPKAPGRIVVGLFNWTDTALNFDVPLARLGLAAATQCAAFDYWQDALIGPVKERLAIGVPAQSCRIIALRPGSSVPQLLSTSRHITQGMVDVLEERWDAAEKTLRGRSRVVGGDPYELRVIRDASVGRARVGLAAADQTAGAKATVREEPGLLRITVASPTSREVSWSVAFEL